MSEVFMYKSIQINPLAISSSFSRHDSCRIIVTNTAKGFMRINAVYPTAEMREAKLEGWEFFVTLLVPSEMHQM